MNSSATLRQHRVFSHHCQDRIEFHCHLTSTHIHTCSTDTAVSDIVEAFHSFSQRADIGIILINQNVSHMLSHDPIVDHMIPSPLEIDSGDDSPPAGRVRPAHSSHLGDPVQRPSLRPQQRQHPQKSQGEERTERPVVSHNLCAMYQILCTPLPSPLSAHIFPILLPSSSFPKPPLSLSLSLCRVCSIQKTSVDTHAVTLQTM